MSKTNEQAPEVVTKEAAARKIVEVAKEIHEDIVKKGKKKLTKKDRENLIKTLTREMQQASRALEFERAAELRDMILELDGSLPGAAPKKAAKSRRSKK